MTPPPQIRKLPDGSFEMDLPPKPPPPPTPWWVKVGVVLALLTLLLLLVSVSVTTYRSIFPRPPAPYYVCVYYSGQGGSATVQGPQPCPRL